MLTWRHQLLATATVGAGLASFSFSPAAAHLAFLRDYQLCGKVFLAAGALLEMCAAVATTSLGDADLPWPQTVFGSVSVPALVELLESGDGFPYPVVVCSLARPTGELTIASGVEAPQRLCLSTQVLQAPRAAPAAADRQTALPQVIIKRRMVHLHWTERPGQATHRIMASHHPHVGPAGYFAEHLSAL